MRRRFAGLLGTACAVVGAVVVAQVAAPTAAKAQELVAAQAVYYDDPSSKLAWSQHVTDDFKQKVFEMSGDLGCDPNHLMATIAFETGATFSPSIRNRAGSGGVGLIQFMPRTAKGLGTSTAELAKMSAVDQLDYVAQHLKPKAGRLQSLSDVYMSVLLPTKVGKPDDTVLFRRPSKAYRQNKGLDLDRSGTITKREAASKIAKILEDRLSSEEPVQQATVAFSDVPDIL